MSSSKRAVFQAANSTWGGPKLFGIRIANPRYETPHLLMKALTLSMFLGSAMFAAAHPGPPGHYHPDEVDEFDQVAVHVITKEKSHFDVGGLLVLLGIAGCLGYAFSQKDGGIWSDKTVHH